MIGEDEIQKVRQSEYPATQKAVHLKASGGSPMCRSAYEACERYLEEMCFEGDLYYDDYLKTLSEGRARIARYIGASPSEIGYTVNSSSAAAIMAEMFRKQGINRVYYPVSEFPTSIHAVANEGIEVVAVGDTMYRDGPPDWLREIDRHLIANPTNGSSALVISHVSFISGETIDIREVAGFSAAHDLLLAVNATQSFGALEIDVAGVDVLFATGLKWASAGYGAGFIYLRQGWVDEVGLPNRAGWLSVEDPYRMNHANRAPMKTATMLDAGGGMPHFGPLMALSGALSVYERLGDSDLRAGVTQVQERVRWLASYLKTSLSEAGYTLLGAPIKDAQSGIVSIRNERAPELFEALKKKGVLTSLRRDPHTNEPCILRFGVHYFNTKKELDSALSVLR